MRRRLRRASRRYIRMGNLNTYRNSLPQASIARDSLNREEFVPVNDFEFLKAFEEDITNGLYFNNIYIPEEIVQSILCFIPPEDLLGLTLVCKKWCNIIKSKSLWMSIYNRRFPNKAKKLPWYIFYCYFTTKNFDNLLKNGNGQEQFKHWKIIKNYGDEFEIQNPPCGSNPLPPDVPDFNGFTSCFATSYYECNKIQEISLERKRLLRYILNKFNPHIYVSEWVSGRFDCGCIYKMTFRGYGKDYTEEAVINSIFYNPCNKPSVPLPLPLFIKSASFRVQQWHGKNWEKVEILIEDYPQDILMLIFEHEGQDTQFWKGHYGSKMAGGVVKIVFDSIEPGEDKEIETK